MTSRACAVLVSLGASVLLLTGSARAVDSLVVCLDENVPPLSWKRGKEAGGFDFALANAVAERLGRSFAVQWFESKADPDSHPDREANALLSDGRCQLVGGFPLYTDALAKPRASRARLPDFDGAKPEDRRRLVELGTLMPTRGYRYAPLAVVLGSGLSNRKIERLADLKGVKLGVEERTLADAILTSYKDGELLDRVKHVMPGDSLFDRMERGEYDATLVELHRFDAYRRQKPENYLALSGYFHSLGVNTGFVGLSSNPALVAEVDGALGESLSSGQVASLAREAGLTYMLPRVPDIRDEIPLAALRGD